MTSPQAAGNSAFRVQHPRNPLRAAGTPAFVTTGGAINGCAGAIGGIINIDSPGAISGAGSVIDTNFCGTIVGGSILLPGSTVTGPDSLGRVLVNFNPASLTINYAGYIVDSSRVFLVETADELGGDTGGIAFAQGTKTGGFATASLKWSKLRSHLAEVATPMAHSPSPPLSHPNSDGSTSGTADFNDIVNQFSGTAASPSGSYTVDATGPRHCYNLAREGYGHVQHLWTSNSSALS